MPSPPTREWKKIRAKFRSACGNCGKRLEPGNMIYYSPGLKAQCLKCRGWAFGEDGSGHFDHT